MGVRVRGESGLTVRSKDVHTADRAIFSSITVWHHVSKLFRSTYIVIFVFTINLFYFYLIPWVLVSISKYLWKHKYSRTREFLTHGSESPSGWNPCGSRYGILNLKYPWVRIRVTCECTREVPYLQHLPKTQIRILHTSRLTQLCNSNTTWIIFW